MTKHASVITHHGPFPRGPGSSFISQIAVTTGHADLIKGAVAEIGAWAGMFGNAFQFGISAHVFYRVLEIISFMISDVPPAIRAIRLSAQALAIGNSHI